MERAGDSSIVPKEALLSPQDTLKSIFDTASAIARRGINFERRFYQSAGTLNPVGHAILVGITVPGPVTRKSTPNELEVYIDLMLIVKRGKVLHTYEYDVRRARKGKNQTFSIERRFKRQELPEEQAKSVRRKNEFVVLFPLSSLYFGTIEQRVELRKQKEQEEINTKIPPLNYEEITDLNEALKGIQEHGYTIDMTQGYKEFMQTGGYIAVGP